MKFTLKDYQRDAVIQVLDNLERAHRRYHDNAVGTSFALTATTGAGKTVMAAAAERLSPACRLMFVRRS